MDKKRSDKIIEKLEELYPAAECALKYEGDPWKLLIMAILSAQCTDARVNIASGPLFERFPTARDMADAEVSEIEKYVKSCGLYRTKAKNLKASSAMLCERFNAVVPDTMDELLMLPGVGRKIGNLILGDIFHKPAVVCDTHCIRLSGRLGYTDEGEKNPLKVERVLVKIIPPEKQSDFCHRLVLFGRECCTARAPKCDLCPIASLCEHEKKNKSKKKEK